MLDERECQVWFIDILDILILILTTNFYSPGQPQPGTVRHVVGLPGPHAPLVGAQPGEEEEEEGDGEVGGDDVDPHVEGKRGEEGEEIWILKQDNYKDPELC